MVEKQEQENEAQNTNVIINNWEYLDDFLAQYLDHLSEDRAKGGIFSELFNNLFTVEEQKKNIPTLNIIREKLWLYYYKEHFKTKSNGSKLKAEAAKKETDTKELCS